jgi:hypothetical protein
MTFCGLVSEGFDTGQSARLEGHVEKQIQKWSGRQM